MAKQKGEEDKPVDCNWISLFNDQIRILVVYIVSSVISKLKNCLKCWGGRVLTTEGRIQILAISKTLYISTMRTPLTQFLELLSSIQKDFIWNKSSAKINHCSLIADFKEGGYKDVDILSKLLIMKISWIKRF